MMTRWWCLVRVAWVPLIDEVMVVVVFGVSCLGGNCGTVVSRVFRALTWSQHMQNLNGIWVWMSSTRRRRTRGVRTQPLNISPGSARPRAERDYFSADARSEPNSATSKKRSQVFPKRCKKSENNQKRVKKELPQGFTIHKELVLELQNNCVWDPDTTKS